ncbi:MAG: M56 family metallopeptidase, partial [Clostridia bacterium]|nr:M56 family metallopeptidase [Clostridia bacterium]
MRMMTLVFSWILISSLLGTVLVALILLAQALSGKKLSAKFHYYVWLLLLLRLLIPYVPESPASVYNLFPTLISSTVSKTDNSISQWEEETSSASAQKGMAKVSAGGKSSGAKAVTAVSGENTANARKHRAISIVIAIWLLGVAGLFIYSLGFSLYMRRKIRKQAVRPVYGSLVQLYACCRERIGVRGNLPIVVIDGIQSPAVFGLFRPKLMLPERMMGQLADQELEYVLLHELTHYKRKDTLMLWLFTAAAAFHWFNPVIWYAYSRMRQDCEYSCDADVLARLGTVQQKQYGCVILHLLQLGSWGRALTNSAAFLRFGSSSRVRGRIIRIASFRRGTWKRVTASVLIAALIGATGMTGASQVSARINAVHLTPAQPQAAVSITASAKETATLWAEALAQREGILRFALLSSRLKASEYEAYRDDNWGSIGASSPWVVSYTVREDGSSAAGEPRYQIDYLLTDSTRQKYTANETVTLQQSTMGWCVVSHDSYNLLPAYRELKGKKYPSFQGQAPDRLPNSTADKTALLWAETMKENNGAFRFALLAPDLRPREAEKYRRCGWA